MDRRISITLVLTSVAGLGVLALVGARAPASSDAPSQDATSDSASTRIQRRPVDPASPNYEGREATEWDALHASERVERAERQIAASLSDGADIERAWLILSAVRADFFASEAGAQRYLELEQALLDAAQPAND